MNLANDSDLIIPGTTGILSAASEQANLYGSRINENASSNNKSRTLAEYLGALLKVHGILQGRVEGKPLATLVPSSRISNNETRKETAQANPKENLQRRPYEAWFREQ